MSGSRVWRNFKRAKVKVEYDLSSGDYKTTKIKQQNGKENTKRKGDRPNK